MRRRRFLQLTSAAGAAALGFAGGARAAARKRVVIVGGGFAGAACALQLRRLQPAIEVSLVDPDAPYLTCPMSDAVLAGLRSLRSLEVPREGLQRAGVRWLRARVDTIDVDRRRLRLQGGGELAYDRLVLAPGIRFLWGSPEGYDEAAVRHMPHAWKAGAQTVLLRAQLRTMDDGGVVAISVPPAPYRCPPAPYERASLIAHFLQRHKPRSKLLIFDANNHFPMQGLFSDAWQALYPGLIQWIPVTEGGAVLRVEPRQMRLHTSAGAHTVAVANLVPPQAPAELALQAGLSSGRGWCPVHAQTFESELVPGVHVIGDACIAGAMPKSGSAASSQGRQCALAIVAAFGGGPAPAPSLDNSCYSLVAPGYAISTKGRYALEQGELRQVPGAGGVSPEQASAEFRAREARDAEAWYRRIRSEAFGA